MATIVTVVSGDQGVELSNQTFVRRPEFLADWSTMRVGIRINFPVSSAALLTGTPVLTLGICNRAGGGYGRSSVGHFLGIKSNDATWVYVSGSGYGLLQVSPFTRAYVTNSSEAASGTFNTFYLGAINSIGYTPAIVLEFVKSGSDITMSIARCDTNASNSSVDRTTFLNAMEASAGIANVVSALGARYSASTNSAVTVNEATYGDFDGVCVSWNRTTVPCYIAHIACAKLS